MEKTQSSKKLVSYKAKKHTQKSPKSQKSQQQQQNDFSTFWKS